MGRIELGVPRSSIGLPKGRAPLQPTDDRVGSSLSRELQLRWAEFETVTCSWKKNLKKVEKSCPAFPFLLDFSHSYVSFPPLDPIVKGVRSISFALLVLQSVNVHVPSSSASLNVIARHEILASDEVTKRKVISCAVVIVSRGDCAHLSSSRFAKFRERNFIEMC